MNRNAPAKQTPTRSITQPWRFGLLRSHTGVTASVERTQFNASLLPIERLNEAGGVAARLIEPVTHDPASNPRQFNALAERMLVQEEIRLIFGCIMSMHAKDGAATPRGLSRIAVLPDSL